MLRDATWRSVVGLVLGCVLTACGRAGTENPTIVVSDCFVHTVTVTPVTVTVHLRDTTVLHGSGTTDCSQKVTVQWQVSDSAVAAIGSSTDSTATLVARASGSTAVTARAVQDPVVLATA